MTPSFLLSIMENVKYPEKNTHEQTKNIKKGFQDPIKKN